MCIRIYVASLAKYNEGKLVGIWIDLPAVDLWEQVEEMLDGDEEWAIHDYEAPFSISEYENLNRLNEAAELDDDYDLPRLAYLVDEGCDLENALQNYQDVTFYPDMNLEDVAVSLVEEGVFGTIPENILIYFDYEKLARDLGYDGYVEQSAGVFRYH